MGSSRIRIMSIVGARPNMMKIAPLMAELRLDRDVEPILVHTGQHYDYSMSQVFFDQLRMPQPDFNLGVGSGKHHEQTAEIMRRFGELVESHRPDMVVVAGDVNSTVACALVAARESIPVAHVEAGLRSFDRSMPEELNRILTDRLADLLFTTEESAHLHLADEGIALDNQVRALLGALPSLDWRAVHALADRITGRDQTADCDRVMTAVVDWIDERLRAEASSGAARLAPLAEVWEKAADAAREAEALNLDKRPVILSIFAELAAARALSA